LFPGHVPVGYVKRESLGDLLPEHNDLVGGFDP